MPGVPAVSDTHRTGCGNVKQMSENAAANQGSRLAWLDALRGFAALCVVFDHGSTLLLLPARSFLYQWLNLGQYGVFVFFLVSGYIVPASLERRQRQGGGTLRRRRPAPLTKEVLAEVVRNVVERVVQRIADAGHRTDGSDGNQGRDEAIFDGSRTLFILKKLQKLRHFRSPTGAIQRDFSPTLRARLDAICAERD